MKSVAHLLLLFSLLTWQANAESPSQAASSLSKFESVVSLESVHLGARILSAEEVESSFISDLNRGYLVLEVGIDPGDQKIDLERSDFILILPESERELKAEVPALVAAHLQKTAPERRTVDLYPGGGIGYETGSYDPWGRRRQGGITTRAGIGVGIGKERPGSTPQDREVMALELSERGLPEEVVERPVSGHLYFRLPDDVKPDTYTLQYRGLADPLTLDLKKPN